MAIQPSLPPLRIIVADDHEWIREILVKVVEQTLPEASIVAVDDGTEALQAYRDGGCNFLITNHMMPKMDGADLIREVRDQRTYHPDLNGFGKAGSGGGRTDGGCKLVPDQGTNHGTDA